MRTIANWRPWHRGYRGRAAVFVALAGGWLVATLSAVQPASPAAPQSPAPQSATPAAPADVDGRAVLSRYCVGCHNDKLKSGGVALDAVDPSKPSEHAQTFERVIRKLRTGTMPPAGRPRPDQATYQAMTRALESGIDRAAEVSPNPGRVPAIHRLNRTEYHNAIRDLLAVEIDVASLLPPEDTSDSGFDNTAETLSIAPSQLERYLSAARKISRLAAGIPPLSAVVESFSAPYHLKQDDRTDEDLPLGSRGGVVARYYFPVDGDYSFKVRLRRTYVDYVQGMGTPHTLEIRIDGELVKRFTVGGKLPGRAAPDSFAGAGGVFGDRAWEDYVLKADEGLEVSAPVKAGPRVVTAAFLRKTRMPQGVLQDRKGGSVLSNSEVYDGNAAVDTLEIGGPHKVTGPGDTPSRQAIFICKPTSAGDEDACATRILNRLARRAFRRPTTQKDTAMLMSFYKQGRTEMKTFDGGVQFALERLLADPDFLLRVERDPAQAATAAAGGKPYKLTDIEVASRLSFFLWSSIPDEALLAAAEKKTLTTPAVLEQQVRRMLADPRARSLVDNFAEQWLHLRKLDVWASDTVPYPYYDDNLREGFKQETQLFIASTLTENRSILDLLRADYSYLNERLARHYNVPGIYGSRFRRVTMPDLTQRGGLLGHGSLLMLSSYPNRTSPVLRGKWLLDTILGAPPPAPPPDVPALPELGEGGKVTSVRQRLESHRKNPVCGSCHGMIDPLGFALEGYDGIGAWRTTVEGGMPVDATGAMPNGTRLDGLPGLRSFLLSQEDQFVATVTEKLLAYSLGRGLEYFDQPAVRKIVRDAAADQYKWSAVISGVVKSPAFLMRSPQVAN